jgi:hypothetical protein
MRPEDIERFECKIQKTEDCWFWTASQTKAGYGQFSINNYPYLAHRVAYELYKGSIPEGKVIDHLCRTPSCVNPEHIEAVSQRVNTYRGISPDAGMMKKNFCPHGHEYTPENTYIGTTQYGTARKCRACRRNQMRKHKAKKRSISLSREDPVCLLNE